MVYCNYCACEVDVEVDDANGFSCCVQCGRVLEDAAFSADITFQKDAGGESTVMGQFVSESGVARGIGRIHGGRVYAYQADSHEKAQQRGRHDIAHLVDMLSVRPREESIESAHRLYKLALQHGFTRGRRTNQVAAACLYLVCRQDSKPFLLIDFSDALQINVFTLGAVFLQLAKLLRLTEHPMFAKPVDPSLYIHRFADRLDFGRQMHSVANTALRLVASMKRDWIQTGRRPSGICGAALYIAAHIHGFERSIRDVVSVVHIGEHTLSKRLYEFSSTSASMYTADEFEERAKQIDADETARLETAVPAEQPAGLLESTGCEHLRMGEAHFAHAMCKACYLEFMQNSGGVYNGANPPAYERNRRKEIAELLALPEPGAEEAEAEEGEDNFEREEHDIAEGMITAFHDTQLQQFAAFLPSTAEEAAVAEEQQAAAAQRRRRRDQQVVAAARKGGGRGSKRQKNGGDALGALAAVAAASGPSQASDQTGAAPAAAAAANGAAAAEEGAAPEKTAADAPAEPAAGAGAGAEGALGHSQRSTQTAAPAGEGSGAAPATEEQQQDHQVQEQQEQRQGAPEPAGPVEGGEEEAAEDAEDPAAVNAGAIVPVPAPGVPAALAGEEGDDDEEDEGDDRLSDIAESDIDMYLADAAEVKCKEEIWNMMNKDWLEKQAAKRAAQEAAEKAAAEAAAAQEAAEAAGVVVKKGRGRPVGSKTRSQRGMGPADLEPAETAQEAAMRMLDHRKLSNKINYSALADLFADGGAAGAGGEGEEAEEGDGRGAAVTAAMRARQQQQQEEEARRQARQQAALEAERSAMAGKRVPGLGWDVAAGAGKLGPSGAGGASRSGLGGVSRRAGGLGSLRDSSFRSGVGGGGKSVRFAD